MPDSKESSFGEGVFTKASKKILILLRGVDVRLGA
jgi:hypothetical protein